MPRLLGRCPPADPAQLLGELAELAGPLSTVLLSLRDELVRACYSGLYAPDFGSPLPAGAALASGMATSRCTGSGGGGRGGGGGGLAVPDALEGLRPAGAGGLVFEQLPWHSVAARLRRENDALRAEQGRVRREMEGHQVEVARVEEQLRLFQTALDAADDSTAALRAANALLAVSEARASGDAATSTAEAKRLLLQVAALQEQLTEVREAHAALQGEGAAVAEACDARIEALKKALHTAKLERTAAIDLAAARAAPEEVAQLRAALEEAEARASEAEARAAEAEAHRVRCEEASRTLTPRPLWDGLVDNTYDVDAAGPTGGCSLRAAVSTSARVGRLLSARARERAELERQLRLARALAAPDAPAAAWRLHVAVEEACCFLTEGALMPPPPPAEAPGVLDAGAQQLCESAAPLGVSPGVPRFLRSNGPAPVPLARLGRADAEAQIAEVWRARAAGGGVGGGSTAGPLHSFLADHLLARHGGDAGAAAAAGYSLYRAACCLGNCDGGCAPDRWDGGGGGAAGPAAARPASAAAAAFVRVLTGQLPEAAFWEQQRLALAVLRLATAMAGAQALPPPATPGAMRPVAASDELAAGLRFLLPFQPAAEATALLQRASRAAPQQGCAWDLWAIARAARVRLVWLDHEPRPATHPLAAPGGAASAGRGEGTDAGASSGDPAGVGPEDAPEGAAAAADALLEELLWLQVCAIEAHTGDVLRRARLALLDAPAKPTPGCGTSGSGGGGRISGDGCWDAAEQMLQGVQRALSEGLGGRSSSGCSGGGGGNGTSSVNGTGDVAFGGSLLATAASLRERNDGNGAPSAKWGRAPASALPGWLRAAVHVHVGRAQLGGPADNSEGSSPRGGGAAAAADALAASIRSTLLLLPRSCTIDLPAALQWAVLACARGTGHAESLPAAAPAGPGAWVGQGQGARAPG